MSCFAQMFGDKLKVDQSGTLGNTEELLKDKVVGIYFSAHWCPPCRSFTPELIKTYKTVVEEKNLDFEIVFVSSDNDVEGFDEYYNEMPWKALPYEDREQKQKLSKKFQVSGIPTLVILDKTGAVITKDGRSQVDSDPECAKFPWIPPSTLDVLGTKFTGKSGELELDVANLPEGRHLGIYFSAHWCPPCKTFTPKLAELYEMINAKDKGKFEVIFASSDKDESQFNEYYTEMPWLAIPYEDRQRKQDLSQKFGVTGIPALVILDHNLNVVNPNARTRCSNDHDGTEFPWSTQPLMNLDEDPSNINDYTSLFYVKSSSCTCSAKGGTSTKCPACNGVMDKLKECGERFIKESSDDCEQEFICYYSDSVEAKIASQLLGAVDWERDDEMNAPMLLLVDIPDGKYCVYKQGAEITPKDVEDLVDKYKNPEEHEAPLQMKQML